METGTLSAPERRAMVSLFLVSLYSISFETFLTRFFSIALFSQYSYWIISIAMFGYSVSGLLLSLFEKFFLRRRRTVSLLVPLLLIGFTSLAVFVLRSNPFNPEEFQNEALWKSQLAYIALYYAGLFPVFFLAGTFVGLNFLAFYRRISRVYAVDLLGAAAGAIAILGLMFLLHPYHLPAFMLAVLLAVYLLNLFAQIGRPARSRAALAALLGVASAALSCWYVLAIPVLSLPDFKPLHSVLNIAGAKQWRTVTSPSGYYVVMNDYSERDDIAITSNYQLLRIGGPPRSYGLYLDGERVTPMLRGIPRSLSYVRGSLPHFPYTVRRQPTVLLVGTDGGYRILEAAHGGARRILALEPQRVIYRLVEELLARSRPQYPQGVTVALRRQSLFSVLRATGARFDIIELSPHYLDQDPDARYAFTRQAVQLCLRSLRPGGILSIPVDISELNVFAFKAIDTARAALQGLGVRSPAANLLVYRTAFTCQILVSNRPFTAVDIAALRSFCWERSFDTSYYPGIRPSAVKVWNDLPPVSFASREVERSRSAQDALMEQVVPFLTGKAGTFHDARWFDLRPATLNRPDFYSVSRLSRLRTLLANMSVLPTQEVGYLFNVFVLGQAVLLALLVLSLPMFVLRRRVQGAAPGEHLLSRTIAYFSLLGIGYLFVELALIEKFSFLLDSSTAAFGVVLSTMLVFSGLGSWDSQRLSRTPYLGIARLAPVLAAGLALLAFALDPLETAVMGAPMPLKLLLAVAVTAPLAFVMGRFFPLGNGSVAARSPDLVPWAWAVNGALSIVSTPLANILSTSLGWRAVLIAALLLYLATLLCFPGRRVTQPERVRGQLPPRVS